jgi:hypothetical protein
VKQREWDEREALRALLALLGWEHRVFHRTDAPKYEVWLLEDGGHRFELRLYTKKVYLEVQQDEYPDGTSYHFNSWKLHVTEARAFIARRDHYGVE